MAFTAKVASSTILLASMVHMLCVVVIATNETNATEVPTTEVPTTEAPTTQAPNKSQNGTAMTEAPTTSQNETATTGVQTTEVQTTQAPTQEPASTPDPKAVREAKVVGMMKIEVENTTISDPKVKTSIQQAIAQIANVSTDSVQVTISKFPGRRLGGTAAKVDYTITIENVADHDVAETIKKWKALTEATMSQSIATLLAKNGAAGVGVIVLELPQPKVEYVLDTFPGSTPSLFQLGKVVFVSVLFLALRPVVQ